MSITIERKAAITANFISMFGEMVKGRVLDVGCGRKPYRPMFPDCEWVGLDARPVGDILADMDRHIESENFDTVLCTDALQYSRDPAKAVSNMAAAVKRGGTLILTAPNCEAEDETSRWRFTFGGLAEMVAACGLSIVYLGDGRGQGMPGLFDALGSDFRNTFAYASVMPAEFQGWLEHLDSTYPMMTAIVAVKP